MYSYITYKHIRLAPFQIQNNKSRTQNIVSINRNDVQHQYSLNYYGLSSEKLSHKMVYFQFYVK